MEAVTWILCGVAAVGVSLFARWLQDRPGKSSQEAEEAWWSAGRALGLDYSEGAGWTLHGKVDGFDVLVETWTENEDPGLREHSTPRKYTRAVLGTRGMVPAELSLKSETALDAVRKVAGAQDVELGEAEFDKAVLVQGPEDVALAVLKPQARKDLLAFLARGGVVREGELLLKWNGELRDRKEIEGAVQSMLAVARSLAIASVPAALLENATKEADPKLRRRNLTALLQMHSGSPESAKALQAALVDADPAIRLLAARLSPAQKEAQQVLEALLDDERVPAEIRASALERLAGAWPYPEVAAHVGRAFASDALELKRAAIAAAGAGRDVDRLVAMEKLAPLHDEGVASALAKALATAGELAEPGLIKLLGHESAAVRREAAAGLGKVGTVRAVEPLLPLTQGVLADGALKDAARDAVRAIQARLGDAGGGRLSVVQAVAEEGALSVGQVTRAGEKG
ncbi:MAG: hypothetical protein QM765_09570 [Myxococcales bacterium]